MSLLKVAVNWMDGYANSPSWHVVVDDSVDMDWSKRIFRKSNGMHVSEDVDLVTFFYTDGKPTHGFGGREISVHLEDGSHVTYKGAWSSRAECVNDEFRGIVIVDGAYYTRTRAPEDLSRGGGTSCGIKMSSIVEWWCSQSSSPGWGLAMCVGPNDVSPMLRPTRNGKIKDTRSTEKILAKVEWEERNDHNAMDYLVAAYAAWMSEGAQK